MLTKTLLRFISVFTFVVLFSKCSKEEGTLPQTPLTGPPILVRSEEKIYEHIVWDLYDAWGYGGLEAHIIDASVVTGRDKKRLTVLVWDEQRKDWSDQDKYDWYLYQDAIHIVNPSSDPTIRGTYANIKVIYF
jgi:hypothetical protein